MRRIQTWANLVLLASVLTGLTACNSSGSGSDSNNADRHRIFVTSTTYTGNLGGLVGADIICTSVAVGAGIIGIYKAVLSSSTEDAVTRLDLDGEVYLLGAGGEVVVATSGNALWNNTLVNPINVDETGATLGAMQGPWTGTNPGGGNAGIGLTCTDWTIGNNTVLGATGDTSTTNSALWVNANGFTCDEMRPLYCVED